MIRGAHFLLYSTNPEADRAFFRDVLRFPYVDDGGGWLIFKLPSAEMGIHPSDGSFQQQHGDVAIAGSVLYLMCDDVRGEVQTLHSKGVSCTSAQEEEWVYRRLSHYRAAQGSDCISRNTKSPSSGEGFGREEFAVSENRSKCRSLATLGMTIPKSVVEVRTSIPEKCHCISYISRGGDPRSASDWTLQRR